MIKHTIIREAEKINYKPLVLGYSFFKVIKEKSDIIGYWFYKKENKLYINYIEKIYISILYRDYLNGLVNKAFASGERAVFYKNTNNEAVIVNQDKSEIILKNQIHIVENKKPTDNYIKELLKNTEGLTIYKLHDKKYLIEIYK